MIRLGLLDALHVALRALVGGVGQRPTVAAPAVARASCTGPSNPLPGKPAPTSAQRLARAQRARLLAGVLHGPPRRGRT
jgi:hypothetical protein